MAISGVFGPLAGTNTVVLGTGASDDQVPTSPITGNIWQSQTKSVFVPANTLQPGGTLDIEFDVNVSNEGSNKYIWCWWGGLSAGPSYVMTAGFASVATHLKLRCKANGQHQVVSGLVAGAGNSTVAFGSLSVDTTVDQNVMFQLGTQTSTASMSFEGYRVSVTNPPTVTAGAALITGAKCFYGVNGHFDESVSAGDVPTYLNMLGCTLFRVAWEGHINLNPFGQTSTAWMLTVAEKFQSQGGKMNICCCMALSCLSAGGTLYASEAKAYSAGYAQGHSVAAALAPHGVLLYEAGNEMDATTYAGVNMRNANTQGTTYADFTGSAIFCLFRGSMHGCIDGIHAAAPTAKVGTNAFVNASIWASDAMWNGWIPASASSGIQVAHGSHVRWDMTNWHLYTEGDGTNVEYSGGTGSFNLLKYLHDSYRRPIIITEFSGAQATTASTGTVNSQWMTTWYNDQALYNIGAICAYELFGTSGNQYALFASRLPSASLNEAGTAYVNFVSAHPALV